MGGWLGCRSFVRVVSWSGEFFVGGTGCFRGVVLRGVVRRLFRCFADRGVDSIVRFYRAFCVLFFCFSEIWLFGSGIFLFVF